MRRSKAGWNKDDIDRLYTGFGFDRIQGGKHCLYIHPRYQDLRATVTRSSSLPIGYVSTALRLIDELRRRDQSND